MQDSKPAAGAGAGEPAHNNSTVLQRFWRPSLVDIEAGKKEARAHQYLASQAAWASSLISELVEGKAGGTYDKLNPMILNSCEGLAFITASKAGFGLTVGYGYGFVIKKLSQDEYGSSQWSQPLFFIVNQLGLGLSAGYQSCQSVIALSSYQAIDVFKKGTKSLGTDLAQFSTDGALMGMSGGAALGSSQHLGMSVANTHSAFCYSKVDGVYLELAMHGSSVTPDHESNDALYGAGVDPDQVLNTQGQYMPDLLPLLRTINKFGKGAMHAPPVASHPN